MLVQAVSADAGLCVELSDDQHLHVHQAESTQTYSQAGSKMQKQLSLFYCSSLAEGVFLWPTWIWTG